MKKCEYGHGYCTAPDTTCPHWQGIFCELDYNEKDSCEIYFAKEYRDRYSDYVESCGEGKDK